MASIPFDEQIYQTYYPGWGRTEAQADWNETGDQKMSQSGGGGSTADQIIANIMGEITAQMDEMAQRYGEFDENNPFIFDEMLARSSAEERYNPYYEAELSDFLSGVERQRESVSGERDLITELNDVSALAETRELAEGLKQVEEGFSGRGLFHSGERRRQQDLTRERAGDVTQERESRFGFNTAQLGRREDELSSTEATGRRKLGAEQTSVLESDIAKQQSEQRAAHEVERAEYLGYPYLKSTGGIDELLGYTFQ